MRSGIDKSNMVVELVIRANHELGVLIVSYCVVRYARFISKSKARRIKPVNKVWLQQLKEQG